MFFAWFVFVHHPPQDAATPSAVPHRLQLSAVLLDIGVPNFPSYDPESVATQIVLPPLSVSCHLIVVHVLVLAVSPPFSLQKVVAIPRVIEEPW